MPVFDRSVSPIRLTECGQEYIKCAEKIMDIQNGFESYLGDIQQMKAGSLRLGASNFFVSYVLPPVLTHFKLLYPEVDVNLTEANSLLLEKLLFAGELDLVADNNVFDENVYTKEPFFNEQLLLSVPKWCPANKAAQPYALDLNGVMTGCHMIDDKLSVPLALFAEEPFIMLRRGNDTRSRADVMCRENGLNPNIILELDQLATAFHVCCHGMGITFVSDLLVKEVKNDENVVYYKLDGKHAARTNYFFYKYGKYHTRPMNEFLRMASESAAVR